MNTLLVEDEVAVATMINKGLCDYNYSVTIAPDGTTGLDLAIKNSFDVIIMDIMLPGMNGLEVCRRLRNQDIHTPVLMLTALGSTENIVAGLDNGADDYLVKPFKFAELEARVRNLGRRSMGMNKTHDLLRAKDLQLDKSSKVVSRAGREISLTATEFRLLEYMLKNKGQVLSRMKLLENVWSINFNMSTNVVDVYVNYLRKKIDKGSVDKLIHTVNGMGYIIKEQ